MTSETTPSPQVEPIFRECEVQQGRKIRIPLRIQETIIKEHRAYGKGIHWHFDQDASIPILSDSTLTEHESYGFGQLTDERIRIPSGIAEEKSAGAYQPETPVILHGHEKMIATDPKTIHLLTLEEAKQILPTTDLSGDRSTDSETTLEEALKDTPKFSGN